ncbi:hypothetical protein NPIL_303261 [Nephila pilipes]|uniref:Uncharacterized protein n=1 Tax=Nephila pilipes TaxID=299642 RepID=A0A8X6TAH9_NEPPI|nr:hypothetical protein NPIL_303261 [Nephila pilipes]
MLQELLKNLKNEMHVEKLTLSEPQLQELLKYLKSEITSGKLMREIFYSRAIATPEKRDTRCEPERLLHSRSRTKIDLKNAAFNYDKYFD